MIYGGSKKLIKTEEYDRRSSEYNEYIHTHIENVKKAFDNNISIFMQCFPSSSIELAKRHIIYNHDNTKFTPEEFEGYLDKFYPAKEEFKKSEETITRNYNMAWLHHYTHNLHHPESWILIEHNPKDDKIICKILEMDYEYLIEMICDWESFAYTGKGTAYDFYYNVDHKDGVLHPNTRKKLEEVLEMMHDRDKKVKV